MSVIPSLARGKVAGRLPYYARVIRVVGTVEFKVKYADSAMGYFWSLAKPLGYFGVLLLVFGRLLGTDQKHYYPVFLLVGILLFTFFLDSVSLMLPSIVGRGNMLRRLSFTPVLIPLSLSLSVCITFLVNLLAAVIFIAAYQVPPRLSWLLVLPLLLELYIFTLGLGLIPSATSTSSSAPPGSTSRSSTCPCVTSPAPTGQRTSAAGATAGSFCA